jgi:hypothetical protein
MLTQKQQDYKDKISKEAEKGDTPAWQRIYNSKKYNHLVQLKFKTEDKERLGYFRPQNASRVYTKEYIYIPSTYGDALIEEAKYTNMCVPIECWIEEYTYDSGCLFHSKPVRKPR